MRLELRKNELKILAIGVLAGILYYPLVTQRFLDGRYWFVGFIPAASTVLGIFWRTLYVLWSENRVRRNRTF